MNKISVIVPVYNSESELERCLDSLLNQTHKNIEIILINDGSTDNSYKICREYEDQYNNIRFFSQDNRGQSSARNRGINEATGDFIGFIDSDDFIHPMMYEYLLNLLLENNGDVSSVQIQLVNDIDEINLSSFSSEKPVDVVNKNRLLEDYMFDGLYKSSGQYSAGRKLFKKELLNNIHFLEGYIFEDILFNFEVLEKSTKHIKSSNIMYYYFQDSTSTMRRSFTERELDLLYICDLLIQKSEEKDNKKIVRLAKMKKARSYFSLLAKIAYFGTQIEKERLQEIKTFLIKGLRNNFSLLMRAPIPINRKIIIASFAINFNISTKLIQYIK